MREDCGVRQRIRQLHFIPNHDSYLLQLVLIELSYSIKLRAGCYKLLKFK